MSEGQNILFWFFNMFLQKTMLFLLFPAAQTYCLMRNAKLATI